jgi:hypothetical protein
VRRAPAFVYAIFIATSWIVFDPTLLHADELATLPSGRKVLLKDDGTWTYADKITPNTTPANASTVDQIRAHCLSEWSDDFEMRAYCESQQKEAARVLAVGKPQDISQEQFASVRGRCAGQWADDFEMRAYCEKQQYEAIRKLEGR